jgi:Tol biopolymer transport system component
MKTDGSDQTRLTNDTTVEFYLGWDSDGTHIVYQNGNEMEDDIWLMNADGSNQHAVLVQTGRDHGPRWITSSS